MDQFYEIRIFLDAAQCTLKRTVSGEVSLALPAAALLDTLLVTTDTGAMPYNLKSGPGRAAAELELASPSPRDVYISYFVPHLKWSADHKVVLTPAGTATTSFEIVVENTTGETMRAQTIHLVNRLFSLETRHYYHSKEALAVPRGMSDESSSPSPSTAAPSERVIKLSRTHYDQGTTRFAAAMPSLEFVGSQFQFSIAEAATNIPTLFRTTLRALDDIPAGKVFFYTTARDFLGQSELRGLAKDESQSVSINITRKVLATIRTQEKPIESSVEGMLAFRRTVRIALMNFDTVPHTAEWTLPLDDNVSFPDYTPEQVGKHYTWRLEVPARPNSRNPGTTKATIVYNRWEKSYK